MNFKVRNDLKFLNEDTVFEGSFIESPDDRSIYISIYRIPGYNKSKIFLYKFDALLNRLTAETKNKRIFIACDHNIDLLKDTSHSRKLRQICQMYGFSYINFREPTRITPKSATCIDNIFTNTVYCPLPEGVIIDPGTSDHLAIYLPLANSMIVNNGKGKKNNKFVSKSRIFSKENIIIFKSLLLNQQWYFDPFVHIDKNYSYFLQTLLNCFYEAFPLKVQRGPHTSKITNNWVTPGIKMSSANKRKLNMEAKWNTSTEFQNYFKNYKKIFKSVVAMAKKWEMIAILDNPIINQSLLGKW